MEASGNRHDVAVLGGGLAALTLAPQLKRRRPETSIAVAMARKGLAPEAAFKVGESTVEISAMAGTTSTSWGCCSSSA
jgi:hypothetical protein